MSHKEGTLHMSFLSITTGIPLLCPQESTSPPPTFITPLCLGGGAAGMLHNPRVASSHSSTSAAY